MDEAEEPGQGQGDGNACGARREQALPLRVTMIERGELSPVSTSRSPSAWVGGLIQGEIEGPSTRYCGNAAGLATLEAGIAAL